MTNSLLHRMGAAALMAVALFGLTTVTSTRSAYACGPYTAWCQKGVEFLQGCARSYNGGNCNPQTWQDRYNTGRRVINNFQNPAPYNGPYNRPQPGPAPRYRR